MNGLLMAEESDPKQPNRSSRRRAKSRAALIEAARETMSVKGVDATTIADITEAADLGFGTFYNHFKSKDEIVDAAMSDMVERLGDEIDELIAPIDDPFFAQIVAWHQVVSLTVAEPIWGWFVLRSSKTLNMLNEGLMGRFRRDVKKAVDAGAFTVSDIDVVANLVGGGVLSLVNARLSGVIDDAQVSEGLAMLVTHLGITPEKARKLIAKPIPSL
ncbi:MAG: TetR/AcrR family transcriptional regulator [Rhodobiaceae bacterium]|nr:TetR/AcrR family transcriptional regulator [Rhodobiaceae bacterium]